MENSLGIIYEDAVLFPLKRRKRPNRRGTRSLKRAKDRLTRIYSENGGIFCFYCKTRLTESEITGDHYVPVSKNGASNCSNIVLCCEKCNTIKADHEVPLTDEQKAILEWQQKLVGKNTVEERPPYIGLVAQQVEHLTLNQGVEGSSPSQPTNV